MKKTMTRTLSLVLTICLIAGLLVVPAAAATVENAVAAVATLKSALELEDSTADTAISFSRLAPESGALEAFGTQPDAAKSYVQGLISSAIEAQLDVEEGMSGVTVTVTSATYTAEDTDTSVGSIAYEATLSVGEDPDATTANIGGTITLTKSTTEPDPEPVKYTVTVNAAENGTVSADKGEAAEGEEVTLTVEPNDGYEVAAIAVKDADNGDVTVTEGKFTMPAKNVTVTVTFQEIQVTPTTKDITFTVAEGVTVIDLSDGTDNLTLTEGKVTVATDATVTFKLTVADGYTLGTVTGADEAEGVYTVTADAVTIEATQTVTPANKTITFTASEGVSVNPKDTSGNALEMTENQVTVGKDVTVTFTLDVAEGYQVDSVTGAESSASGVYTVTAETVVITASQTVTPPTKVDLSTKSVTLKKGETVLGHESAPVVGDVLTAVVSDDIPAADVDFVWTVGDTAVADNATDTYTVAAADLGKVIKVKAQAKAESATYENATPEAETAAVEAATYTVTVNAGEHGTATADKTEAAAGEKVTLTITPAEGYKLGQVTGVTLDENNQFTMPAEAVTVTVTFVAVDKTALNAAIAAADAAAKAITVATSADEVAKGAKWILQDDLDTYNTAIAAADTVAKKAAATQDEVDNAVKALATATTVFEEAQDVGTNENVVDKTELKAKYNAVKAAVEAAVEATDGSNVPTDAQWITSANKLLATPALYEVESLIANANATADEVAEALAKLATVEGYLQPGTKVPEPTEYTITVNAGEHGTATASVSKAAKDTEVTLTITPEQGYEVDQITSDDVTVANNKFTMPEKNVTIEVTFKQTQVTPPADPAVKDAQIVFITKDNYETLAPTYNNYGAETLRPAADVQLPWLLVSYDRTQAGTVTFAVKKDGQAVSFSSGDDKSATLSFEAAAANANAWISFHMVSQANTDHKGQTWLDQADAAGEYEVTVTMGEDTATATATYTKPEADKTELVAAIKAAQAMLDAAKTAESGAEILKTDFWATADEKTAMTQAIAAAQTVADDKTADEQAVADAVTALETAVETNLHSGEKDVTAADLTAAIDAAKKTAEDITVAEDADTVKRGEEFVTAEVKADYNNAIAKAEAVAKNAEATPEEIEAALAELNEATLVFNAAKQEGTKSSGYRPSSGGGVNNNTTDTKTETLADGTKRTTETAKDGTVTVTDTKTDGTKTVTTTTPTGEVTTDVTLGRNTESVQVAVAVDNANSGLVAVIVKPDGTEEIIRDSVVVDDEVIFDLDENAKVKIVNKAKSFVDTTDHWAKGDVDFVSARELFNGVSDTHFAPDATMTRGMMATVLFRLDGEGKVDKNVDFSDVTSGDWFAEAVNWAAEIGMINGYTDGSFGPNRSITREELVVMIYRYAGAPAVEGQDMEKFDDAASVSNWATAAMTWAIQNGIINGKTASTIDPKGDATRAEVSAVLQRYVKLAK